MKDEEIRRRLKALLELPHSERPISVYRLAWLVGIKPEHLRRFGKRANRFRGTQRAQIERALLLLENGQVLIEPGEGPGLGRGGGLTPPPKVTILEKPHSPQRNIPRVRLTAKGPKLEYVVVNPNTFPVLDPVNKQGVK